jgi:hypothetical protein
MVMGGVTPVFGESKATAGDLDVVIADNPRVSLNGRALKLTKVKDQTGEKHFTGKSAANDLVRIIQFEKPEQRAPEPPATEKAYDWTKTASPDNPTLVEEVVPKGKAPKPQSKMVPSLVTAVTDKSAAISWDSEPGATAYTVYRDGTKVLETQEPRFSVDDLEPDTSYVFEIKGMFELEADGSSATVEKTVPVETLSTDESTASGGEIVPLTYQPYNTAFTYETFIEPAQVTNLGPDAVVSCGLYGQYGVSFSGDNRGYRTPGAGAPYDTPDYRTMMFTNINWDSPAPYDVVNVKGIQPTKKYQDGRLVETRTATMNQMYFKEIQKSGSYAQVRYDHAAGNPFCSIGNIRYDVVNRFYRSGLVETVGYRQQAPSHEAYARFNNTGSEFWVTQFRLPNAGFNCLFELSCAQQTINYSQQR